jgi:hypothetical protein
MRRKKRVKVVEMPLNDPQIERYVIKKGIPVEIPAPIQVPVERPAQVPLQEPRKWTPL